MVLIPSSEAMPERFDRSFRLLYRVSQRKARRLCGAGLGS
jgi:hypothetical protein